jgi:predicted MFS family arabinose efflux permease
VQGYLSSAFAEANISGPILGDFFLDAFSWHWVFWINLPLGVAAFAATWFQLCRLPRPGRSAKIDWLGALLIALACTPVLVGITLVQRDGNWFSPGAWGCFALGAIGLIGLIL